MIILGFDPGSSLTGYGIVNVENNRMEAMDYGVLNFTGMTENERLLNLSHGVRDLIIKHKPGRIALESLFFSKNKKTALQVSEARGVIKLVAADSGTPLFEYRPAQVKQSISTYGRAQKAEVQKMVMLLLNLDRKPTPDDVADALAVAICAASHSWVERTS